MATDEETEVALEHAVAAEQEAFERDKRRADLEFDPETGEILDPEPAGEPEPDTAPPSDVAAEKAMSELEKLSDRYTKQVAKVLAGTDLGLVECPVCPVPGFVPDAPQLGMPPERLELLLAILGAEPAAEQPMHPNLATCPTCDGWGLLQTGSRRGGFNEQPCPECGGNGYVDKRQQQALQDARPPDALQLAPSYMPPPAGSGGDPLPGQVKQGGYVFYPTTGGAQDPFGRIAGHPLWGQPSESGGI